MHPDRAIRVRLVETVLTSRLKPAPTKQRNATAMFAGRRDDALHEFTAGRAPRSLEAPARPCRRLQTRTSPDGREAWLNWTLWSLADGDHAGLSQATLHYVLFRQAWSWDSAREATSALIDELTLEWGVREIWATVDVRHRRSIALLEDLGFLRMIRRSSGFVHDVPAGDYVYCLSLDLPHFPFLA